MWSGPRTVSTALMRAWENRPDTVVTDEPLYAFYLARTGLDHPGRDDVLRSQPADWQVVARSLTSGPLPAGRAISYQKHMTHHLLPEVDRAALAPLRHAFLIRDPAELLASYARVRATPTLDDLGLWQQSEIFDTFDERNRNLIVNVVGRLTHRDEAAVSPFDSAVQGGDAVWEGLRLYQGRIFRLGEHLARLRRSAAALAFTQVPGDAEITEQISRTLRANGMTDGVHIRLTLTRGVKLTSGMDPRLNQSGPTLIVLAEFKDPVYDQSGLALITSSVRRPPPDVLDPKIHHNNLLGSILAKVEANIAGADDAVMLDGRGFVAETNATHLFLVCSGVLGTPATVACPEGITRAAVLELAAADGLPCVAGDHSLTEFYAADEVFVTGTMGGLAAVIRLDGRVIGNGAPGPVTRRLTDLYAGLTATSGTPVA